MLCHYQSLTMALTVESDEFLYGIEHDTNSFEDYNSNNESFYRDQSMWHFDQECVGGLRGPVDFLNGDSDLTEREKKELLQKPYPPRIYDLATEVRYRYPDDEDLRKEVFHKIMNGVDKKSWQWVQYMTKGQSENEEWFAQRMCRLTASTINTLKAPLTKYEKDRADGLEIASKTIKTIENNLQKVTKKYDFYGAKDIPYTINYNGCKPYEWGAMHEKDARNSCRIYHADKYPDIKMFDWEEGLVVNPLYPFLGGSPDGVMIFENELTLKNGTKIITADRKILEYKCPVSLINETEAGIHEQWAKYAHTHKIPNPSKKQENYKLYDDCFMTTFNEKPYAVLEANKSMFNLKKYSGYYGQVQLNMLHSGCNSALFYVWMTYGSVIEEIPYDREYVDNLLSLTSRFTSEILVPYMLDYGNFGFSNMPINSAVSISDSRKDAITCGEKPLKFVSGTFFESFEP